jgi:potassium efflux system protein
VVTIGTTDGVVTRIQIRATTIRTWDRQELLVPNKEFITGRLLNWSLSDQTTRVKVPVGVAYGSDVEKAMTLMGEAAAANSNVLAEPAPSIIFDAFGDNALNLVLRVFVDSQDVRMTTMTQLHQAINKSFNAAGISIAFPQRDVHLDTLKPLDVRISRDSPRTET